MKRHGFSFGLCMLNVLTVSLCMAIGAWFSLYLPSLSFVLCMAMFAWSLVSNLSLHVGFCMANESL